MQQLGLFLGQHRHLGAEDEKDEGRKMCCMYVWEECYCMKLDGVSLKHSTVHCSGTKL